MSTKARDIRVRCSADDIRRHTNNYLTMEFVLGEDPYTVDYIVIDIDYTYHILNGQRDLYDLVKLPTDAASLAPWVAQLIAEADLLNDLADMYEERGHVAVYDDPRYQLLAMRMVEIRESHDYPAYWDASHWYAALPPVFVPDFTGTDSAFADMAEAERMAALPHILRAEDIERELRWWWDYHMRAVDHLAELDQALEETDDE